MAVTKKQPKAVTNTRLAQKSKAPAITERFQKRIQHVCQASRPYTKNSPLGLILLICVAAPQLVLIHHSIGGSYVTVAAFAALVIIAAIKSNWRNLCLSTAIIPLALMVNLSLPKVSFFEQTVIFYAAILLLAQVYRYLFTLDEPLKKSTLSFRGYIVALPYMFVTGQILGIIGYSMLRHNYPFGHEALPVVAVTSVFFAIAETTLFQGLIQQQAARQFHPRIAAILAMLLYPIVTIGHTTIWAPVFALLVGAVLALTYYRKQNLLLTMTINALSKLAYVGLMASFIFRR
jgi:membrane protease YdiL (CAAX protease family)